MIKLFQPKKLGNVTNRSRQAVYSSEVQHKKKFRVKNFKQLNKNTHNGAHVSCQ